jgi:hypothetical protein
MLSEFFFIVLYLDLFVLECKTQRSEIICMYMKIFNLIDDNANLLTNEILRRINPRGVLNLYMK